MASFYEIKVETIAETLEDAHNHVRSALLRAATDYAEDLNIRIIGVEEMGEVDEEPTITIATVTSDTHCSNDTPIDPEIIKGVNERWKTTS